MGISLQYKLGLKSDNKWRRYPVSKQLFTNVQYKENAQWHKMVFLYNRPVWCLERGLYSEPQLLCCKLVNQIGLYLNDYITSVLWQADSFIITSSTTLSDTLAATARFNSLEQKTGIVFSAVTKLTCHRFLDFTLYTSSLKDLSIFNFKQSKKSIIIFQSTTVEEKVLEQSGYYLTKWNNVSSSRSDNSRHTGQSNQAHIDILVSPIKPI